jgi:hypothetical protein
LSSFLAIAFGDKYDGKTNQKEGNRISKEKSFLHQPFQPTAITLIPAVRTRTQ